MNEDLGNPSRTCFVRGENLWRRYSGCWDWRTEKVRCIRNISQRTECERSPDNPKKMENFVFPAADGSTKLSRRDYEFQEPTLRLESTVKRENPSGESQGDRVSTWRIGRWRRSSERLMCIQREFHLFVIILNREFNLRAERRIIPHFTRFTLLNEPPPRRSIRCGERIGEKPKHLRQKQNQMYLTLQERDRILYSITTWRKNSFRWKDIKKALRLIPFESESKHMLSRLAAQRICETKFFK